MKVYVALDVRPWEHFSINHKNAEGEAIRTTAESNEIFAGFLPVYWSEEELHKLHPDAKSQEVEVADDWHPRSSEFAKPADAAE